MTNLQQTSFTDELKQATRDEHAALEKLFIEKIRHTDTRDRYEDLLRVFYGYYKPVEDEIARHIDREHFDDFDKRRKSASLLTDLGSNQSGELLCCNDLPVINDSIRCLGALYVLEGSTLGGNAISRLISRSMGIAAPLTYSFFNCYGSEAPAMWTAFREKLNAYVETDSQQQAVMSAANETFRKFKTWICAYEWN